MKNLFQYLITFCILGVLAFASCRPTVPTVKPIGYFKIDYPEHEYQTFDSAGFPYSFSYPVYATITQDEKLVKQEHAPYWINVNFPKLNATIYLSYKRISGQQTLTQLIEESYKLSYAHDQRADYIKTPPFETKSGLYGVMFNVGGNAASTYQFFITDTVKNFVRGSLYFDVPPNIDSLKPSIEFLRKDMDEMIQTFRFK